MITLNGKKIRLWLQPEKNQALQKIGRGYMILFKIDCMQSGEKNGSDR